MQAYCWLSSLLVRLCTLGFVLNIGIMFFVNWIYGLVGVVLMLALYVYLAIRAPAKDWGDISQALMFHQVRKYLLRINDSKMHSKFWRPNILLLVDNPSTGMIGFCNSIKKGGLLIVSQVIVGDFEGHMTLCSQLRSAWTNFMQIHKVKAFSQVCSADSLRDAVRMLLMVGGLGGMSVNTVCIPLPNEIEERGKKTPREDYYSRMQAALNSKTVSADLSQLSSIEYSNLPFQSASEFCAVLHSALQLKKNILLAANFDSGAIGRRGRVYLGSNNKRFIDVWLFGDLDVEGRDRSQSVLWGHQMPDSSRRQVFATHHRDMSANERSLDDDDFHDTQEALSIAVNRRDDAAVTVGFVGLASLVLQLGAIADHMRVGPGGKRVNEREHAVRIMYVPSHIPIASDMDDSRSRHAKLVLDLCNVARMDIAEKDIHVFTMHEIAARVPAYRDACTQDRTVPGLVHLSDLEPSQHASILNAFIKSESVTNTCQVFMPIPYPPSGKNDEHARTYLNLLTTLSHGLPPTVLVCDGEDVAFISTSL
jgi:hypothetical protein